MKASISGISLEVDFIVKNRADQVLMLGMMQSSLQKVNMAAALCGMDTFRIGCYEAYSTKGNEYHYLKTKMGGGYSGFYYGLVVNKDIGKKYILSTQKHIQDDYYNYLMGKFKYPLMEEWKEYLYTESMRQNVISYLSNNRTVKAENRDREISIGDRKVLLRELELFEITISENMLRMIISEGLKNRRICISERLQQPIQVKGLDDYMLRYGNSIGEHMEKKHIFPMTKLKRNVDGLALLSKKLYAPQAACVNGLVSVMQQKKDRFAYVVEEMGCGKTIQAISAVEAYHNQKWLKAHPGKTLKDCFQSKEVGYRVAVMCPSHLPEKWKYEIEKQIPFAKVIIVTDLSQLIPLREKRKNRDGKEVYIFSKEFAKADTYKRPVPSRIGTRIATANICMDCLSVSAEDGNDRQRALMRLHRPFHERELLGLTVNPMRNENGVPTCIKCKKHRPHLMYLDDYGKYSGMICPSCDNLLIRESTHAVIGRIEDEKFEKLILQPEHFYKKSKGNENCSCCCTPLWEDDVAPMNIPMKGKPVKGESKSRWHKIKFYSNFAKKKKGTYDKGGYALTKHENECVKANGVGEEWVDSERKYGPRRTPAARYCKKYLKGAFDCLIADEAHLYEGVKTEQAIAMHHLMKASKFTLPMTGTISNGTAASFFALFFMTMPGEMVKAGYSYTTEGMMAFSKKYGVVETSYEYSGDTDYGYNASGRGRQLASPRVRPGISPLLYVDFLVNHSVMLNMSDMSKHMPPLKEYVRELDMPRRVKEAYDDVVDTIKEMLRDGSDIGKGLMAKMFQFGLSYPDKPYGRETIYSLKVEDCPVVEPDNLEEYSTPNVLLPKEKEMIEIINQEVSEGRDVFVYTEYSGEGEANISYRLLEIIETHCNLKGQVRVLESKDVKPIERELYIKKNSDKVKVWITNYRNVETGIDFIGEYEGRAFNYPTIIFIQIGMTLSSVWQASLRHYRLSQIKECRTYYFVYRNTFQKDMLEMMSKKISAASAIQGNFSESALENMMGTEDPTVKLAKKLLSGDMENDVNVEELLAQIRNNIAAECDESGYIGEEPVTFYDVMGDEANSYINTVTAVIEEDETKDFFSGGLFASLFENSDEESNEESSVVDNTTSTDNTCASLLAYLSGSTPVAETKPKQKGRTQTMAVGQFSFF